jgi:hypothetical protein
MGSGAMMYVPSFIKLGSVIQKMIAQGYTYRMVILISAKQSRLTN